MPTYVYRCKKGHTFELFHGISDDGPKRCPRCRSGATRVPAGGSGLLFKGSGFHVTDYRSSGYKDSAKKESGAGSEKSSGGAGTEKPAGGAPGAGSGGKGDSSSSAGGGSAGKPGA